jgi:hypothetical protein
VFLDDFWNISENIRAAQAEHEWSYGRVWLYRAAIVYPEGVVVAYRDVRTHILECGPVFITIAEDFAQKSRLDLGPTLIRSV